MTKHFNQANYLERKRRERFWSWAAMLFGGFILLDSGAPIPIPLVGLPSMLLGGALLGFGYYQYGNYRKLPLHEAVAIARDQKGELSRTDLFLHLRLTAEQTDELIHLLIRAGFLEPVDSELPAEQEARYRLLK
jgi:hypothetical protein